jgi:hypothetical protein
MDTEPYGDLTAGAVKDDAGRIVRKDGVSWHLQCISKRQQWVHASFGNRG